MKYHVLYLALGLIIIGVSAFLAVLSKKHVAASFSACRVFAVAISVLGTGILLWHLVFQRHLVYAGMGFFLAGLSLQLFLDMRQRQDSEAAMSWGCQGFLSFTFSAGIVLCLWHLVFQRHFVYAGMGFFLAALSLQVFLDMRQRQDSEAAMSWRSEGFLSFILSAGIVLCLWHLVPVLLLLLGPHAADVFRIILRVAGAGLVLIGLFGWFFYGPLGFSRNRHEDPGEAKAAVIGFLFIAAGVGLFFVSARV